MVKKLPLTERACDTKEDIEEKSKMKRLIGLVPQSFGNGQKSEIFIE